VGDFGGWAFEPFVVTDYQHDDQNDGLGNNRARIILHHDD